MAFDEGFRALHPTHQRERGNGCDHVSAAAHRRGCLKAIFDMTPVLVEGKVVAKDSKISLALDVDGVVAWTNTGNGYKLADTHILREARVGDTVSVRLPAYVPEFAGWNHTVLGEA